MDRIKEAFFTACKDAEAAKPRFVSLYMEQSYYGGPEEGGWWGSDTVLVAYQEAATEGEAKRLQTQIEALAQGLSKDAKDTFNRRCLAETEWLEARGLDDDFLPQVDGEDSYWVTVEPRPGGHAREGSRHYE